MSSNESDELLVNEDVDESVATLDESPGPVQQHAGDYAEDVLNIDPDARVKEFRTDLASDNEDAIGKLPGLLDEGQ
jgi:hypothetical protein